MSKLKLKPGDQISAELLAQWQEDYDGLFEKARRLGLLFSLKSFLHPMVLTPDELEAELNQSRCVFDPVNWELIEPPPKEIEHKVIEIEHRHKGWPDRLAELLDAEAQQGWSVLASFQAYNLEGDKEPHLILRRDKK